MPQINEFSWMMTSLKILFILFNFLVFIFYMDFNQIMKKTKINFMELKILF